MIENSFIASATILMLHALLFGYFFSKAKYITIDSLLILMCISLPISYINIYGELIGGRFTLFNISSLLLLIFAIYKLPKIKLDVSGLIFTSALSLFIVSILYSFLVSPLKFSAFTVALSFLSLLSVPCLVSQEKKIISNSLLKEVINNYILGVGVISVTILIQSLLFLFGTELGSIFIRVGRFSFGATFSDYSVLAVYLATGIVLMVTAKNLVQKTYNYPFFLYNISLTGMFLATVLTGARAGIFSIAIALFVYFLFALKKRHISKLKILLFSVITLIPAGIIFQRIRSTIGSGTESFIYGDSRFEIWLFWIDKYMESSIISKLFGLGLGSANHEYISQGVVHTPHNILIDIFINGGIGFFIFFSLIFIFSIFIAKKNPMVFIVFLCSIVGGLVSPSIISARFFIFIVLIIILLNFSEEKCKIQYVKEI